MTARKPVAAYATLADVVRAKLAGTLPVDLHVVVDNDSVCALSGRDADDYHGLSDDGPATARAVAKALDLTPRRAQQMLALLGQRGRLCRAGKRPTRRKHAHLWALP